MSEAVKIHYKATVDNLLFLKRQQWTITNYALILYAAVIALARETSRGEKQALTILMIGGCWFALHCVRHTQKSMTRYYRNLYDIHQRYLTAQERDEFDTLKERPGFNHNGEFIWGLMAANVIAFALTFYLVWWKGGFPTSSTKSGALLLDAILGLS